MGFTDKSYAKRAVGKKHNRKPEKFLSFKTYMLERDDGYYYGFDCPWCDSYVEGIAILDVTIIDCPICGYVRTKLEQKKKVFNELKERYDFRKEKAGEKT